MTMLPTSTSTMPFVQWKTTLWTNVILYTTDFSQYIPFQLKEVNHVKLNAIQTENY